MAFCEVCSEVATEICSVCKTTYYCSRECQKADWKIHKKACPMNVVLRDFNEKARVATPTRPARGVCTGCNSKFTEDSPCEDECRDCGYLACESCSVHKTRGTCYCPNSNFGTPYCCWNPRWWHNNGRGTTYTGDRHPRIGNEYADDCFEPEERQCTNCGKVTRMLKKQFCTP